LNGTLIVMIVMMGHDLLTREYWTRVILIKQIFTDYGKLKLLGMGR
jgi:hypothetical protein